VVDVCIFPQSGLFVDVREQRDLADPSHPAGWEQRRNDIT
jgi:hypothetical protein